MKYVVMYSKPTCKYCVLAKELLEQRGIPYAEVEVGDDDELRFWLERITGRKTVPQIFIGERAIGGYSELAALDADDGLKGLLS